MNVRSLTRTGLFVIAVAGSLAPGVASAQNREHQQLFADVRMLQEQTQQLRLAVASLSEALAKVGPRLDEQAGATRKLFADQGLVIGALTDNARILREKLDATNVSLSKEAHEMETMRQELAAQRTLLTQIITLLTAASAATDPSARHLPSPLPRPPCPPHRRTRNAPLIPRSAITPVVTSKWRLRDLSTTSRSSRPRPTPPRPASTSPSRITAKVDSKKPLQPMNK